MFKDVVLFTPFPSVEIEEFSILTRVSLGTLVSFLPVKNRSMASATLSSHSETTIFPRMRSCARLSFCGSSGGSLVCWAKVSEAAKRMRTRMNGIKYILFLIVFVLTQRSFAYKPQEGNVTAIAGPFLYKTNFGRVEIPGGSPELTGFGLVALGDLNKHGALEIGLFTLKKYYLKEWDSRRLIQSAELLHITMGYRYYISKRWSTSLTFFSGYALGTPTTHYTQFGPGEDVDTSARDKVEYGLDIAGQFEIASYQNFGMLLDARYSWSLTPKERERSDHYGMMFALRYVILSKDVSKSSNRSKSE